MNTAGFESALKAEYAAGHTDEHPDWIDAVCSAYEKLPQGTREALQSVADIER